MAELTEADKRRRVNAKRFNERVKLFATFQNNTAIAIAVGAVILPMANAASAKTEPHWIWLLATGALHSFALLSLGVLKSED